jgi:hypothetical protein
MIFNFTWTAQQSPIKKQNYNWTKMLDIKLGTWEGIEPNMHMTDPVPIETQVS